MSKGTEIAVRDFLAAYRNVLASNGSEPAARLVRAMDGLGSEFVNVEPVRTPTCEWLDQTLAATPPETAALQDALAPLATLTEWREGPREGAPAGFDGGYAYVELVGQEGQIPSAECRIGLYLQRPGLFYPAHAHDAEELYVIVNGGADWQAGERRFEARPGMVIHHAPAMPHIMTTGEAPLLAIWAWLGDIEGRYWFL